MQDSDKHVVSIPLSMLRRLPPGRPRPILAGGELQGDWDFGVLPFSCPSADPPCGLESLASLRSAGDLPEVGVGRNGDFVLLQKHMELKSHREESEAVVSARIVGRHPEWNSFRRQMQEFAAGEDGLLYAPIAHPDLRSLPSWNNDSRWRAISCHLAPACRTALDIGANFGYMSYQLERAGKHCTAVEVDDRYFYFLAKLKRACSAQFTAIHQDIFEFVENRWEFDTVLALAVFHHFIKSERNHRRLLTMLQKLQMKEMFFWAHNPEEGQMQNAFRNYRPGEFVEVIKTNSCLNRSSAIAEIEYRQLFHLWHE